MSLAELLTDFPTRDDKENDAKGVQIVKKEVAESQETSTKLENDSQLGLLQEFVSDDVERHEFKGEVTSVVPELIALEPDLVREQDKKNRKLRRTLQ
jgi:hypothetical protein